MRVGTTTAVCLLLAGEASARHSWGPKPAFTGFFGHDYSADPKNAEFDEYEYVPYSNPPHLAIAAIAGSANSPVTS